MSNLMDFEHINDVKNNKENVFSVAQRGVMNQNTDCIFDMAISNNFLATITADITIDFTNLAIGRGGVIIFDNTDNHMISKQSNVLTDTECLAVLSSGGKFILSYITDGTDIFLTYSKALS